MNDCLKSFHVFFGNVPDVLVNVRRRSSTISVVKPTISIKSRIKTEDFMPSAEQHRRQHCPDISVSSCDEHFHIVLNPVVVMLVHCQIFQGALPESERCSR